MKQEQKDSIPDNEVRRPELLVRALADACPATYRSHQGSLYH